MNLSEKATQIQEINDYWANKQSKRVPYKPEPHVRKAMRIRGAGGPMCIGRDHEAANPCLIEPGHKGLHRGEGAAWSNTVYDAAPMLWSTLVTILDRLTDGRREIREGVIEEWAEEIRSALSDVQA